MRLRRHLIGNNHKHEKSNMYTKNKSRVRSDVNRIASMKPANSHWNALVERGKAMLYRNGNWKDDIYVVYSKPEEFQPFLSEHEGTDGIDISRSSGIACCIPNLDRGRASQLLWVRETGNAMSSIEVLVHEAIHAAADALAVRNIPLDIRHDGLSNCLAFFVEDFLTETLPFFEKRIGIRGADRPVKQRRKSHSENIDGHESTLNALKRKGLAFEHVDKTWRAHVTAVVCDADDANRVFRRMMEPGEASMGQDTGNVWFASKSSHVLMWADGSQGARVAFASLAHGAIHAAGNILADRGVDVDLSKSGSSECVAYLVQRFFENIRPWFLSRFAGTLRFSGKLPA